jgi:sulfite exporter TauE/SafE
VESAGSFVSFLAAGLAYCRAVAIENGGVILSLAFAGLVGGFTHCLGMCGPFVLAQTAARLEATPAAAMGEFHRLGGALLVPYHLGRLTTYAALGAVAGGLAGGAVGLSGFRELSAVLLAAASLLFLAYAAASLGWRPARGTEGESAWARGLGRAARPLFARPTGWRGYGLGLALGFLPCGLLYGALAAAASGGGALAGSLGMGAFALGTVPALLAAGYAGHAVATRFRGLTARVAPGLLVLNAALLAYFAWRLVG